MSYCINPSCTQPQNPEGQEQCQSCGSCLTLDEELLYRAEQPLVLKQDTQLYEVVDIQGNKAVLKVLSTNSTRLVQLFEREIEILQRLTHPGIPEFKRAFSFETHNGTQLHCLVMEKIEGQNLEQWMSLHPALEEGLALKWLKQLVEILYGVHRNGFLHQDIKPANILCKPNRQLVLIDFSNIPGIVSAGFTPPEQADGNAVPSSDFFAIGRTFASLLTGKHPLNLPKDPQTQRLIWQNQATQISQPFATLVDELMAPLPEERPQDALEILARIDEIQENLRLSTRDASRFSSGDASSPQVSEPKPLQRKTSRTQRLSWGLGVSGWGLAALFAIRQFPISFSAPVCDAHLQDSISCGEESFLPDYSKNSQIPEQKKQGTDDFAAGNYLSAVKLLTEARNRDLSDPETLIYLNNARLAANKTDAYTIAVVVPLSTRGDLSLEALRGVAQVQDEINRIKINGRGLRVLVADDTNEERKAKDVAAQLVKRTDVLGVVGHYTSEMTLAALPTYQAHSLVLMSYGSTSADLSGYGFLANHVFFRTVPTTQVSAIALASYLRDQSAHRNVAVFYNPRSPYSRSLRDWFQVSINALQGVIVDSIGAKEPFNLCQDPFDAGRYLNYIQEKKATAIAIFPDGKVCESSYPNAINMIPSRKSSLPIVGSWLFMSDLKSSKSALPDKLEKFVVAAPWNRFSPQAKNSSFLRQADMLWIKPNAFADDKVSGLTAVSYDAALVLVSALKKLSPQRQPQRIDIQKILAAKQFRVEGATGTIQFMGGDRQEPVNTLLKVVPSRFCNSYGYSIVPLNYDLQGRTFLDCSPLIKRPS
jgi:eukaryotic-like serine/threonine-protein kinase